MANVVSTQAGATVPARKQEKGVFTLNLDTVEASAVPQNDIYYIGKLPSGCTVVGGAVEYDAAGANTEIQVGYYSDVAGTAVDADRLLAAQAITSAGTTQFNGGASLSRANTSGADYYIGILFSGSGAATGTIRVTAFATAEVTDQT